MNIVLFRVVMRVIVCAHSCDMDDLCFFPC